MNFFNFTIIETTKSSPRYYCNNFIVWPSQLWDAFSPWPGRGARQASTNFSLNLKQLKVSQSRHNKNRYVKLSGMECFKTFWTVAILFSSRIDCNQRVVEGSLKRLHILTVGIHFSTSFLPKTQFGIKWFSTDILWFVVEYLSKDGQLQDFVCFQF